MNSLRALALVLTASPLLAQTPCGSTGVEVIVAPEVAAPGEPITVTIVNNSPNTITIPNLCAFDGVYAGDACQPPSVTFLACPEVLVILPPGQAHVGGWDQTDGQGNLVDPGVYSFDARYVENTVQVTCCVSVQIALGTDGCFGDGGDQAGCTDCPCGNNAVLGTDGGCLHGVSNAMFGGAGARLEAFGSTSLAAADLGFRMFRATPTTAAVLTSGTAVTPGNPANPCATQNPGSGILSTEFDGLRCVASGVLRHGLRPVGLDGATGLTTDPWGGPSNFFNFEAFVAGETRHFQAIYRETQGLGCGMGLNTTQRVTLEFTP